MVSNETGLPVSFYTETGLSLGKVSTSNACLYFPHSAATTHHILVVRVLGEPSFFSEIAIDMSEGWEITVGPWPNARFLDVLSLKPRKKC